MIGIAQKINKSQDSSGIKVGLKDEIFQSGLPVLTGIDASSTYCCFVTSNWLFLNHAIFRDFQHPTLDTDFEGQYASKPLVISILSEKPSSCLGICFCAVGLLK